MFHLILKISCYKYSNGKPDTILYYVSSMDCLSFYIKKGYNLDLTGIQLLVEAMGLPLFFVVVFKLFTAVVVFFFGFWWSFKNKYGCFFYFL